MGFWLALGTLVAPLLAVEPGELAACVLTTERSSLDWSAGVVRVTGRGIIPADDPAGFAKGRQAAVTDAYRNLAEATRGVHIEANDLLGSLADANETVRTRLQAFVVGARLLAEQEIPASNGRPAEVLVVMEAPLHSEQGLGAIVLDQLPSPRAAAKGARAPDYTGVVVDARGAAAGPPALFPVIRSASGELIYHRGSVDAGVLLAVGGSVYYHVPRDERGRPADRDRIELAPAADRIGDKVLWVRAQPASDGSADLVLSREDAAALQALSGGQVLREGRLIVLRQDIDLASARPAPAAKRPPPAPPATAGDIWPRPR